MNIVRFDVNKLVQRLLLILVSSSITFLIYINMDQGLADTGIYLDIGEQVFTGVNPYIEGARTGLLGTTTLYIFSLLIPNLIEGIFFQIMNIFGVILFSLKCLPIKSNSSQFLVYVFLLLWTSPIREMLVTHQITGIIFGLLSFGFSTPIVKSRNSILTLILRASAISIAIDLKPHLAIGGLIIILTFFKHCRLFISTLSIYCAAYIYLNLKFDAFLHSQWFENITLIDNLDPENKWNDVANFWPILDMVFGNQKAWYLGAIVCSILILILIIIASTRNTANIAVLSWGIWPIFANYSHLYDIIILSLILTYYLTYRTKSLIAAPILLFLVIPQNILLITNQILLLCILLFFILSRKIFTNMKTYDSRVYILLVSLIPFFYLTNNLEHSAQIESALRVSQVFILSLVSIWYYRYEKIPNLTKEKN